jgi:nucleotide-binding universal stress UspA family protein
MYKRILLASDETRESLVALREGALIARALAAEAFLLIVERPTAGHRMADGIYPVPRDSKAALELLGLGLTRLRRLGVSCRGEVVFGEPAAEIAAYAQAFQADLIVVGHRRRSLVERWWSGQSGAYLVDTVACSVLVARDTISDAEFEAYLQQTEANA